jgi:hypothetical protein
MILGGIMMIFAVAGLLAVTYPDSQLTMRGKS